MRINKKDKIFQGRVKNYEWPPALIKFSVTVTFNPDWSIKEIYPHRPFPVDQYHDIYKPVFKVITKWCKKWNRPKMEVNFNAEVIEFIIDDKKAYRKA